MAWASPLVMLLMEQEENERKRREETQRASDALLALQKSWRSQEDDQNPYQAR